MASFDELDFKLRVFMKLYRYRRYDSTPHTPLRLSLSDCRVALVTTAGFHTPEDIPFDDHFKGGDYSYREIPNSADIRTLEIAHRSTAYDQSGLESDPNLAFPLERFHELEDEGVIGSLNARHFSFMGSVTAPGRLIKRSAPAVAQHLKEDSVDVVFLAPIWPMCNQSVGLIQRAIEDIGISTVSITLVKSITERVNPPRALSVPYRFGYPLGEPNNPALQRKIIQAALDLFRDEQTPPVIKDWDATA